ncbi:MAG: hypothetical protein J0L92_16815 [Deltaproteobacteria bacterium]|nr:hypothetical protein [Deltaproteobacteria bacterium]
MSLGDTPSRLSPAARAIGLREPECAAIRRHALRLEANGDWPLALDAYRMATIVDPTRATNWFGLARCYRHLGDVFTAQRVELCARIVEEKLS